MSRAGVPAGPARAARRVDEAFSCSQTEASSLASSARPARHRDAEQPPVLQASPPGVHHGQPWLLDQALAPPEGHKSQPYNVPILRRPQARRRRLPRGLHPDLGWMAPVAQAPARPAERRPARRSRRAVSCAAAGPSRATRPGLQARVACSGSERPALRRRAGPGHPAPGRPPARARNRAGAARSRGRRSGRSVSARRRHARVISLPQVFPWAGTRAAGKDPGPGLSSSSPAAICLSTPLPPGSPVGDLLPVCGMRKSESSLLRHAAVNGR